MLTYSKKVYEMMRYSHRCCVDIRTCVDTKKVYEIFAHVLTYSKKVYEIFAHVLTYSKKVYEIFAHVLTYSKKVYEIFAHVLTYSKHNV